jgi:hypothetical protein
MRIPQTDKNDISAFISGCRSKWKDTDQAAVAEGARLATIQEVS